MAVTATQITQQIRLANPNLKGKDWLKLSSAIGKGVQTWLVIPANVQLQGAATGVLGVGVIPTGKVIVAPSISAMVGAFASSGLKGVDALRIAKAIATGVSSAINTTGEYYGSSAGVGTGVDVCKVIRANQKTLQGILMGSFTSLGIVGSDTIKLSRAISVGVSSILFTGVGTSGVTGRVSPIPSGGVTTLFMR